MIKLNKGLYKVVVLIIVIISLVYTDLDAREGTIKLKVATSFAPITNIVHNIGGCNIDLYGIIPEGSDSHTFQPIPSDIRYIADADLIILNGLNLEILIEKLVDRVKNRDVEILRLGNNTITKDEWKFGQSFPEKMRATNPHLWNNPAYVMVYARLIRDKLIELDPENKKYYKKNASLYLEKLDLLDRKISLAIKTIPEKKRRLLTYHDSFAYFADRYGIGIIGAIQPADFSNPSAKEVRRIIDQIKRDNIPAIFGSEVFPSKILKQIGREGKVKWIRTLRDDDLPGKSGEPIHILV
ncbi:MAG: metal ABC transporter substrate-binding protein [Nitrospirota bacterium]